MKGKKVTRRKFVADAGKIGLGVMIVPRHVLGGVGYQAPSDTINFAVVGFGGMGSENALQLAKTENLVAFADVDFSFSEKKVEEKLKEDGKDNPDGITLKSKFDKAARYSDFREMLGKLGDNVDAVNVAIPDHMHAFASIPSVGAASDCGSRLLRNHSRAEFRMWLAVQGRAHGRQVLSRRQFREALGSLARRAFGRCSHARLGGLVRGRRPTPRSTPAGTCSAIPAPA